MSPLKLQQSNATFKVYEALSNYIVLGSLQYPSRHILPVDLNLIELRYQASYFHPLDLTDGSCWTLYVPLSTLEILKTKLFVLFSLV